MKPSCGVARGADFPISAASWSDLRRVFENDGAVLVREVIDPQAAAEVRALQPEVPRAGIRNAMDACPGCRGVAESERMRRLVVDLIGPLAFVTRAILFDKREEANWAVPAHQDTTIAVQSRIDVPGFGPWSIKGGVHHVQPPAEVLAGMVTVRVHLDDCTTERGPLYVYPGTHRHLLSDAEIGGLSESRECLECVARAGDAVIMSPLVVHGSAKATGEGHRRVLHLEFSSRPLPGGLQWAVA